MLVTLVPAYFIFNTGFKGLALNIAYYIISSKLSFYIKSGETMVALWKFVYNTLALVHPQKDMTFMNSGYADNSESGIFIDTYRKS